ncbi:MAG: tripartite tricarboxylate transporter TctB family protein [Rhodospirillales bacterium]|nr:tripartite tricarboxylate transporter TctB family protein [Rhodospirillales bacterium]
MQDKNESGGVELVSVRTMEIVVALILIGIGTTVMADSIRVGADWIDPDGPAAGYFPFYIGLLLSGASAVTLIRAIFGKRADSEPFVETNAFKQVLLVLIPLSVYVGAVMLIGIYVASFVYIGAFMRYFGKYGWLKTAIVSFSVVIILFMMFEVWFLVPLPKGPVEDFFGY